jgi:cytochrome c-type biogenesis protein CcmH
MSYGGKSQSGHRAPRRAVAAVALVAAMLLAVSPAAAYAAKPSASLTDIENDVMCVACHESLAVAQSPEAYSERQYIRQLIDQGLTKQQIESQLVAQYGPSVLGKPPANGFNLVVYVVPVVIVVGGVALLAFTIPRWRRRTRRAAAAEGPTAASPLDPSDAQRLDEDLARQA